MGKMGQKWGVLVNQKIWSLICLEVCIICCIPVQIPYFGKIGFCDMNQNALGQSDCRIFLNQPYLKNKLMKWRDLLHGDQIHGN